MTFGMTLVLLLITIKHHNYSNMFRLDMLRHMEAIHSKHMLWFLLI